MVYSNDGNDDNDDVMIVMLIGGCRGGCRDEVFEQQEFTILSNKYSQF